MPSAPRNPVLKQASRKMACLHCGYTWLPRIEGRQAKCPNCQSRKWDIKPGRGK